MSERVDRLYVDAQVPAADRFDGGEPTHLDQLRPWLDVVFEAPKPVSVVYMVMRLTDRAELANRIVAAHEAAVDQAVGYLHQHAAWAHVDGQYLASTGLVTVQLGHLAALDEPGEPPHLHTHVLIEPYVVAHHPAGRRFDTAEQLLADALAAEPDAPPERVREIRADVQRRARQLGTAYGPSSSAGQWVDLDRDTAVREARVALDLYGLAVVQQLRQAAPELEVTAPGPKGPAEVAGIDPATVRKHQGERCVVREVARQLRADPRSPDPPA